MSSADNSFLDLAVPGVHVLQPYQPGKPVAELEREHGIRHAVKLASNENPFGPSPLAVAAAQSVLRGISRYPESSGYLLAAALARRHGVPAECITLGNGSNDVLDLVARVFLGPGTEAVYSQYAFAVYPIAVQAVGARARVATAHSGERGPAYGHDLAAMQQRVGPDTRVVFIANPNNPTGTWLDSAELEGFIAGLPGHVLVVVDEAYFEYVTASRYPDATAWLERYHNLIVTRTFSKAYGLAGLRVGYALSHPDVAALLNRVRQPFNINAVAQAAALAALDDAAHIRQSVQRNREGMAQLCKALGGLGLSCIESAGNFVTVDMGRPGREVFTALLRMGVIVRPVDNYGMPNHLRVTIGSKDELTQFLEALERVLH
ncbi:MAG: histidinol-phosphate transaminase [Gammaproteobacteria bacterium]|jgi:histidinol-phosphate aminotransferase